MSNIGRTDGWRPILAIKEVGGNNYLVVEDWVGGKLPKPPSGQFVGEFGYVSNIEDAVALGGGGGGGSYTFAQGLTETGGDVVLGGEGITKDTILSYPGGPQGTKDISFGLEGVILREEGNPNNYGGIEIIYGNIWLFSSVGGIKNIIDLNTLRVSDWQRGRGLGDNDDYSANKEGNN